MLKQKLRMLEKNSEFILNRLKQKNFQHHYLKTRTSQALQNMLLQYKTQLNRIKEGDWENEQHEEVLGQLLDLQLNKLDKPFMDLLDSNKNSEEELMHDEFLFYLTRSSFILRQKQMYFNEGLNDLYLRNKDKESWELIKMNMKDIVS